MSNNISNNNQICSSNQINYNHVSSSDKFAISSTSINLFNLNGQSNTFNQNSLTDLNEQDNKMLDYILGELDEIDFNNVLDDFEQCENLDESKENTTEFDYYFLKCFQIVENSYSSLYKNVNVVPVYLDEQKARLSLSALYLNYDLQENSILMPDYEMDEAY